MAENKNNLTDKEKKAEKAAVDKAELERIEAEKAAADKNLTKKFFVKSESELGFKKRNYFISGINKRVVLIANAEIDENTYNLFTDKCKEVFFKK